MRRAVMLAVAIAAVSAGAGLSARQPVRAQHAMVAAREAHATDAGLAVLESGGNAIDAAVAVGFVLAVTHPSAGNLGGGGFMLVRFADGRSTFIDFRERAPGKASHDMYIGPDGKVTRDSLDGYRASGVPGTVRGFELAHEKYGHKPWKELVEPAVRIASEGFPVSYGLAHSLSSKHTAERLGKFPESKRIFLRDGKFYEPGEKLVQPELAQTLARIRDRGAKDFYEGETAAVLAADMREHGGLITLDDLKTYRAVERQPLTGRYKGYTIITAPPPSSGGVGVLQMLGMLEGTGFEKYGAGSAGAVHFMAEAMRRYFADRSEYMGDPDFYSVPVSGLLNPRYIAERRRSIDPERATSSDSLGPGKPLSYESTQTTHYSIVDAEGNAVAVTYTLNNGYGSAVTATKLGFLLNDEMDDFAPKPGEANAYGLIQGEANAVQPRKTPLSSMTPTIVLRGGKLYLVVGSPGGPTIINTVLEVAVNVMDFGMNVADAVDFPRFHHQWKPDVLQLERGFSPDTVALLEGRGYTVKLAGGQGEVAAIRLDGGWLEGSADPRTEGTAKGY
ncbi:MAG TPA: gamma-glutamyltransferase [Bryobacteraceae bacterium]|nr:gamma-glutamyltransferase [Bryobacteraceae bacterium]